MNKPLRLLSLALAPAALLLTPLSALATNYNTQAYKSEAQPCPQVKTLSDALYIGVDLGYDSYRMHSNVNASVNGDTFTGNPLMGGSGFVGGIFGGYGAYLTQLFYFGGEVFVNLSGASAYNSFTDAAVPTTYNSRISPGTSFGLAILPGVKINDSSLLYVRLGGTLTDFENNESVISGGVGASDDPSTWLRGFTYGLGIETAIYQAWSLRTEFTHTDYNKSSYSSLGTYYSPANNQAVLSLIYHIYA